MKIFRLSWFTKNLILKVVALILAIIVYFYIQREIGQSRLAGIEIKTVEVIPNIQGTPPEGYRIYYEGIKINPPRIAIAGKLDDLNKVERIYTEPIDVSKVTNTTTRLVSLQPLNNIILIGGKDAVVEIPIVKE